MVLALAFSEFSLRIMDNPGSSCGRARAFPNHGLGLQEGLQCQTVLFLRMINDRWFRCQRDCDTRDVNMLHCCSIESVIPSGSAPLRASKSVAAVS